MPTVGAAAWLVPALPAAILRLINGGLAIIAAFHLIQRRLDDFITCGNLSGHSFCTRPSNRHWHRAQTQLEDLIRPHHGLPMTPTLDEVKL